MKGLSTCVWGSTIWMKLNPSWNPINWPATSRAANTSFTEKPSTSPTKSSRAVNRASPTNPVGIVV